MSTSIKKESKSFKGCLFKVGYSDLKKLIRYSDPVKDKKTLFIWPEGVFSGYDFNEISIFKKLISSNFSQSHQIIFGVNTLDPKEGKFYNSMLVINCLLYTSDAADE